MIKSKPLTIPLLIGLLLGVTACAAKGQPDPSLPPSAENYRTEKEWTLRLENGDLSDCFVTDQAVYYLDREKGASLMRQELDAAGKPSPLLTLESNEVLHAFTVTESGEILLAVKCFEKRDDKETDWDSPAGMELRKTDDKGRLLWKQELGEVPQDALITGMIIGSDERIYLSSQTELYCFDETGKYEKHLTVKGQMIQQLTDAGRGKIALRQNTRNGSNITVYEAGLEKELFQRDFAKDRIWLSGSNGFYYLEQDLLVRYDWETDSSQAILRFTDCGISASALSAKTCQFLSDKRYFLGLQEEDSALRFVWLNVREGQFPEESMADETPKTPLSFAVFNAQGFQNSVVKFNRSHQDYEITLQSFQYPEQETQFYSCLASRDNPDLFEISGRIENYVRNGYLLDLTPYLENSDKIDWKDYISRLPEDIAVDGKIYALPKTMNLTAIACPSSLLRGKDSWTINEYLDLLEEYPDALSWEGASVEKVKAYILTCALYNGLDGFIDRTAGKIALDGEDFRAVLKRIAALDVKGTDRSFKKRAREGEVLFWELYLHSAVELQEAEGIFGQEMTLIGYPVSGKLEGEVSSNHISYGNEIGIHRNTANAQAAWEYLETHFLSAQEKNSFFFTPGKDAFEEKLQEGLGEKYTSLDGASIVTCPELTEAQVDKVREAAFRATVLDEDTYEMISIITEEAAPYFAGQKDLDPVVEIIQSRLQVYLDERG